MNNSNKEVVLHSAYWISKKKDSDAVIAAIKDVDTDKTRLGVFRNPKRKVWILKEELCKNRNIKTLTEPLENLREYVVPNVGLRSFLQKKIHGETSRKYYSLNVLINDLKTYGSDIAIKVLVKQAMYKQHKSLPNSYRVGGFDIETSVIEQKLFKSSISGEVIITSYVTPEGHVYINVLRQFLKEDPDSILPTAKEKIKQFYLNSNNEAKAIMDELDMGVTVNIYDSEANLLINSLKLIHDDKPDYVSIWNIDYDIPYILNRLKILHISYENVFCHPDVPNDLKVCKYKPDRNSNLQHVSHAWHYFEVSGYTQFYDGMCLYSRHRKHSGVEDSYALDAIALKELGAGKVSFGEDGHAIMQSTRQVEYCAYGGIDSLILVVLEKKINDIGSLNSLIPYSDFGSFAYKTQQLKNRFFPYCLERNIVPASQMGKQLQETDAEIVNVGGNVLPPSLAWRTGVNKIKEIINFAKNVISKIIIMVKDLDVSTMYPSIMQALNISKETKVLTILNIEGHNKSDIVDFCGHVITPEENSVYLCNKYLNLPNYEQMSKKFDKEKQTKL